MFEALGDRIQGVFKELKGEGHLTEYHLDSALREIRLSLLEADVALPVVRDFTARCGKRPWARRGCSSCRPPGGHAHRPGRAHGPVGGQKEDCAWKGGPRSSRWSACRARARRPPRGSSRSTEGAGAVSASRAADLSRPAAVSQMKTLGRADRSSGLRPGRSHDPVEVAREGVTEAR